MTEPSYTCEQIELLEKIEQDVGVQLAHKKKRLAHSLGVASTAEQLACAYGADPFLAKAAGLLHDWVKACDDEWQIARAHELGIELGVPLELVPQLLHGIIAAHDLPSRYPTLDASVWQAIARHTTADPHMSLLDMVLYIADGIEPGRHSTPELERMRAMVGSAPIKELFFEAFCSSMKFVIETKRYLWPSTLETYNSIVLANGVSLVS